jgi:hypothetical protein
MPVSLILIVQADPGFAAEAVDAADVADAVDADATGAAASAAIVATPRVDVAYIVLNLMMPMAFPSLPAVFWA